MSNKGKRGLQSLVNFIGDENIGVQFLNQCATNIDFQKKKTKITFVTEIQNCSADDLASGKPERTGIIVWVKTDDLNDWKNSDE